MPIVKDVTIHNSFARGDEVVTIAAGGSVSGWLDLSGNTLSGLMLESALTASAIQFDVSMDGGATVFRLYDDTNTVVQLTLGAGRAYALDTNKFYSWRHVRLATTGTVPEAAARTVRLVARPL